jgi:tetratricopeptide (TPR) repeat protein
MSILHSSRDQSLKAQFYLKLAWALQRASTGRRSDRAVESALIRARSYAENSGDRAALGLLAYRTALYLTKKQSHLEAVNQLVLALEAYLITGNYDLVQSTCGNIGSIIHRLGPKYYREARQWLLLSIAIARWMKLGRDDAHAEMILGKIYVEVGDRVRSRWLLARAERIAERAGNQVNLADVKMVWAFWYQRFGSRRQQIDTLISALRIFHNLTEFDTPQKEKYIAQHFPEVWDAVISRVDFR